MVLIKFLDDLGRCICGFRAVLPHYPVDFSIRKAVRDDFVGIDRRIPFVIWMENLWILSHTELFPSICKFIHSIEEIRA